MSDYLERNGMEWRTHGPKVEPVQEFAIRRPMPGDGGKSFSNGWPVERFTLHHSRDKDPEVRIWLDEAAETIRTQMVIDIERIQLAGPALTATEILLRQAEAQPQWNALANNFRHEAERAMAPLARKCYELLIVEQYGRWERPPPRPPVRLNRIAGAILAEWPPHPHSKPNSCASWRKPA